jgi:hypothetical protein
LLYKGGREVIMLHRVIFSLAISALVMSGQTQDRREASTRPATRPATRPVGELIAELGHKDFRRREEAGRKLELLGEGATEALDRAKSDADPEVRQRAEEIARRIRGARRNDGIIAKRRAIDARFPQPGQPRVISARNSGAAETEISVAAGEQKTVMRCTREGFFVRNRKVVNGDEKVEVWRAVNREELKRSHPMVYDCYVETVREMTGGDDATEETIRRQMVWFEQFLTPPPRADDPR